MKRIKNDTSKAVAIATRLENIWSMMHELLSGPTSICSMANDSLA